MKLLKSEKMKNLLKSGQRKAARIGYPPPDGLMFSLTDKTEKNGWHYQVEWIHDTRIEKDPYIIVCAFKPPRDMCARPADYYLLKSYKGKGKS